MTVNPVQRYEVCGYPNEHICRGCYAPLALSVRTLWSRTFNLRARETFYKKHGLEERIECLECKRKTAWAPHGSMVRRA